MTVDAWGFNIKLHKETHEISAYKSHLIVTAWFNTQGNTLNTSL